MESEAMVTIPARQLTELHTTIATLQEKLSKRNHNSIDRLNNYRKANPEKAAASIKRYKDEHREEINAQRREAYRLKKAATAAASAIPPASEETPTVIPE